MELKEHLASVPYVGRNETRACSVISSWFNSGVFEEEERAWCMWCHVMWCTQHTNKLTNTRVQTVCLFCGTGIVVFRHHGRLVKIHLQATCRISHARHGEMVFSGMWECFISVWQQCGSWKRWAKEGAEKVKSLPILLARIRAVRFPSPLSHCCRCTTVHRPNKINKYIIREKANRDDIADFIYVNIFPHRTTVRRPQWGLRSFSRIPSLGGRRVRASRFPRFRRRYQRLGEGKEIKWHLSLG